jgi:hypothetical protein
MRRRDTRRNGKEWGAIVAGGYRGRDGDFVFYFGEMIF